MGNNVEIINGSRTSFGPRGSETRLAAAVSTFGVRKQLVVPVKFDALPEHTEGDVTGAYIPDNAVVTAVYVTPANTAFAGGTSYEVDLVEDDGTSITGGELVSAITLAAMNAGGEATINNAIVTEGPAFVELNATGTFTAGEGALVIEYIEQIDMF